MRNPQLDELIFCSAGESESRCSRILGSLTGGENNEHTWEKTETEPESQQGIFIPQQVEAARELIFVKAYEECCMQYWRNLCAFTYHLT